MADQYYRRAHSTILVDAQNNPAPDQNAALKTKNFVLSDFSMLPEPGAPPTTPPPGTPNTDPAAGAGDTGYYPRLSPAQAAAAAASATTVLTTPYTPERRAADVSTIAAGGRKDAQSLIDTINKQFDSQVDSENAQGEVRERETNAENAARGLVGSPDAFSSLDETRGKNKEAVEAINAKRSAQIAGIFQQIDQNAITQADNEHAQAIAEAQGELTMLDTIRQNNQKIQADARASFASLASAATLSWSDLQKQQPDYAAKLLAQTGYDPFTAEMTWNNSKTAAQQVQYKSSHYDPVTGEYVVTGIDPTKTGPEAFVEKRFPADATSAAEFGQLSPTPYNDPVSGKTFFLPKKIDLHKPLMDQAVWWQDGKLTKVTTPPKAGTGKAPAKPKVRLKKDGTKMTAAETKIANINDVTEGMKANSGTDKHVSNEYWNAAKKYWLDNDQGTDADFNDKFGNFIDPSHADDYN